MIKYLNKISKSDEYNDSLHRYNKWFIKLRWYAACSLIIYWLLLNFLPFLKITNTQSFIILFSSIIIAVYNYYFLQVYKKGIQLTNSPLKVSILQIIFDLLVLSIIVYFSGGIEAPIFMFYLFHMIIASLILPTKLVYVIAEIKRIMYNNNALFALMSGSGSTVFGIFNNVKVAESVIDLLPNNYFCLINNPDH